MRKDRGVRYLMPSLFGVSMFFIIPFGVVIYYALIDSPVRKEFVFLDNIIKVLNNAAFQMAAKNTFTFSVTAVPLAVVLSLLLALILERSIPLRSQFRTAFLSPMMVPVASVILIFQVLFHHNGAVNEGLAVFGVDKIDWLKSEYAMLVVVLMYLWKNLGYNMILFMAALGSMPKEMLEVAWLEGASSFQTFRYIKLRYLSPTILFVTIYSLINSFKIFREVHLLTGNYPFDTLYTLQHFMNNMFEKLNYQRLSAAAIIMSAVMIVIIGALFLIENYYGKDVEG
ncbi:MAG: sugar ABC transporter permease [Lachnospiraceae bacterium]|nr:sugar ABC transporter permease [Lachnospiraceae bacterium]